MDKDRTEICKIMSEMFDSADDLGIYKTSVAYEKLESLVHLARIEAMGWTHADACVDLDSGRDPRQKVVPEMLDRALVDLGLGPTAVLTVKGVHKDRTHAYACVAVLEGTMTQRANMPKVGK